MVFILFKYILSNFWRYCACSLLYNYAAFLFWLVVPLVATKQDASNWDLAIINAINFGCCFLLSWVCGFINNFLPGWLLARIGVLIYIAACILLMFINDNLWILWIMGIMYAFSYVLFWIPIQTSISRESTAGDAEFWLGVFSGMWTFGQSLGYLCGAFLFTKLGISQALSISVAALVIVFIIYPCWEGSIVCGKDLSYNKVKNTEEMTEEELKKEEEKKKKEPIIWKMGKNERAKLKKRTMQFLIPSFVCCITCYGNLLTYGSQYFNRIFDTKDGYFPTMKDDDDRYDIFIGVFFCTIYFMYTIGILTVAQFKFMYFNRGLMYFFMIVSIINHFICGVVSHWIAQLLSAVFLGLCGAYSFQNVLITTSRLSMLTSNISSIYVGLQESLTYNMVAFSLPLIVGPISDSLNDYRIPMFGCAIVGVVSLFISEISWQLFDIFIIRKMDKKDVQQVIDLCEQILNDGYAQKFIDNPNEYHQFCRDNWLTPKQIDVLFSRLKRKLIE
ncbi:hypothetical protein EDI_346140 [Entamoeba dispar SAW760]|uniref:Major facilitator superfamily (MFS) profile domain-containing protein n=1 Tax=Entamoeba dispar (strain ATCC PRA-260 / SAW760) TaxID=370354 RepID=B0E683_ENTDS|nr:uncharacterized protein EDI_346140 [Entamoeba dispar SAW760]EDR29968.1 hypothetical protein EDI_346140 [Entamoeba dispar SAW760]|eukprot:EDR29968.1 hypothetical protein EDI_346140 [Entamoeba dispar SAW760]